MFDVPLQVVDSFFLNYNVGDALLLIFVLGLLGTIPFKSRKVTMLHVITFGLLFIITPSSLFSVDPSGGHLLGSSFQYKLLGLILVIMGPIIYVSGEARSSSA